MNFTNRIFNIRIALFAVLLIVAGYLSPPANAEEDEWKFFLNDRPELWDGYLASCFIEDGEYMWVGTNRQLVFKIFKETLEAVDTLNFSAADMAYDREGNIWMVGSGLKKLVGDTLIGWDQNNFQEIGLPGPYPSYISVDSTGIFWLGFNGEGLVRFDGESCIVYDDTNAPFKKHHLGGVIIYSIVVDKNNNIWVTTALVNGIMKFDHKEWTVYDSTNTVIKNVPFKGLEIDKNNNIWAGSTIGLYKYDGTDWYLYNDDNSQINGLVDKIAFDNDNNLWFSTNNHIGLVNYDGINWRVFNQSNSPIHGNRIFRIYIDKKQNVWFQVTHDPESGEVWKGQGVNIYRKGGVILNIDERIKGIYQVNTFPNPVYDFLTINSEVEYNTYEIIDLRGVSVVSGSFNSDNSINVSSLVSGTYCLRLIYGQSFNTVFFIKN
ncbi:MAG: T9SS type A sorting domain-containing protein [Ignavibacteriae bacterium]|nr:T9SS type A sorting domain-containing protein [Ignavibacteriota bacterium]